MLGAADIPGYLLERQLLSPRAVVDGRLRLDDVSRRGRVFVARAAGARCLAVKLGDPAGIGHEAAVLARLREAGLARGLPQVVAHDPRGVLVLESAPAARDLVHHHARGRFSCALAREAGRALAAVHALPPAAVDGLPRPPPAGAGLHRPDLATRFALSDAALELTRIVQGSAELCAALEELGAAPAGGTVVHGDVRWDNCLAVRAGSGRWTGLELIDWEHGGAGDPAGDVGAFVAEYLRAWRQSIPVADPRAPELLLAHAHFPLRSMRPALAAFWAAYAAGVRRSPAELGALLQRATRFAAVRLLTAALEEAQARAELRPAVLGLLPLSRNILRRPQAAATLCGLGAAWAAA